MSQASSAPFRKVVSCTPVSVLFVYLAVKSSLMVPLEQSVSVRVKARGEEVALQGRKQLAKATTSQVSRAQHAFHAYGFRLRGSCVQGSLALFGVAQFIDACLERVYTSAGPPVGNQASDQP